jgi:hypothetical protein
MCINGEEHSCDVNLWGVGTPITHWNRPLKWPHHIPKWNRPYKVHSIVQNPFESRGQPCVKDPTGPFSYTQVSRYETNKYHG